MRVMRVLLTPVLVLVYWQAVAQSGLVSAYLLPAPWTVAKTAMTMWETGLLPQHIAASLQRVAQGFSLSVALGCLLAALTARFSLLNQFLAAPLSLLRMVPPLALIPLLILWLGIGEATQITIIVLASFFPFFLNVREGLSRLTDAQRELARSLHLSPFRYIFYVVLPCGVPSIITGLRLTFGYSWRALVGAELIAASSGLGYLVVDAQQMMHTDEVIVGILTIGLFGWSLDAAFRRLCALTLRRRFPELDA